MGGGQANQWDTARHSYGQYQAYIELRTDRCELGLLDLLYVRNFKGGHATTNEPTNILDKKLESYTEILRSVQRQFGGRDLRELNDGELNKLIRECQGFLRLAAPGPTHIDGFGAVRTSALLHFHFPDLAPILDRRVLIGAGIIQADEQAQEQHYPALITYAWRDLRANPDKTLTQLDRELFIDP